MPHVASVLPTRGGYRVEKGGGGVRVTVFPNLDG